MIEEGFPECPLFGGKNMSQKRVGTYDSVRCPEFRGGHFSEVANVLQVSGLQSVTRTLGSVSASRSVCSGRFDCTCIIIIPSSMCFPPCSCVYAPCLQLVLSSILSIIKLKLTLCSVLLNNYYTCCPLVNENYMKLQYDFSYTEVGG